MVASHHLLNEHAFEQTPGDGEGQGSLTCYSPQGYKERDLATEQQNNANVPNVEQDGNLALPNCAQVYLANLIIQKSTPSTHLT